MPTFKELMGENEPLPKQWYFDTVPVELQELVPDSGRRTWTSRIALARARALGARPRHWQYPVRKTPSTRHSRVTL